MSLSRRELLAGTAGVAAAPLFERAPEILLRGAVRPVVVSAANGNGSKDADEETCVARAYRMMSQGADVLDALIAGVNIVELDPHQDSVGLSGIPNANGVVQLDSCCMHGPRKWAGGVAALEGVSTPSKVAQMVASSTDHHLLVGQGAQDFARDIGFAVEPNRLTDHARAAWLEWKRRTDSSHYLDPKARADAGLKATLEMAEEGLLHREHVWGTINCNGINAKGEICGVTTTSGLAFKIPGRVGDSPILGAGLYVDNQVGAAGSTGRGEANLYNLCSFLIVEEMRRGKHPKDAGFEALRRVAANTREGRLLGTTGHPNFGLNFYILDATGRHAGVAFTPSRYAVCDENGPRIEDADGLYPA